MQLPVSSTKVVFLLSYYVYAHFNVYQAYKGA